MRRPPRLAERLLAALLPDGPRGDSILGDLHEEHLAVATRRPAAAYLWYWLQSLTLGSRFVRERLAARAATHRQPSLVPAGRGDAPMRQLARDIRFAFRSHRKQPLFTAIVVSTIAVGLGANAAVFGVVDALLLRPFPLPHIDRVVQAWEAMPKRGFGWDRAGVAPANFLDWQREVTTLDPLVALEWWDANLIGTPEPERVQGFRVSPGFFRALGIEPALGRGFADEEALHGRHRVAILGDGLWTRRYARDPALVGQVIRIDNEPYTLVGIAPAGFDFPMGAELWAPLAFDAATAERRDARYLETIGRLRPGVSADEARAELTMIARRLADEHPANNAEWGITLLPLSEAVVDVGVGPFLAVWQTGALLLLLLACLNVANLLLARGTSREKELALRLALGSGRWRLIRQLLAESVTLALAGALLAVPIAWAGLTLIRTNLPPQIERFVRGWDEIDLDLRLLLGIAALAILTGLIVGVLPALRASGTALIDSLKEGGRSSAGSSRHRLRSALVVAEIALSLTLLVAAGLSIRGVVTVLTRDDGYRPEGVLTLRVSLPEGAYEEVERRRQFFDQAVSRLAALPKVVGAGAVNFLPSGAGSTSRYYEVDGQPVVDSSDRPVADYRIVTPRYFDTMGIELVEGRGFDEHDLADGLQIAIVSRKLAEQRWPGTDPIGRRFRIVRDEEQPWLTVVGVARDVRHNWFMNRIEPTIYVPVAQASAFDMSLVVRTTGEPTRIAAEAVAAVHAIDANQPVYDVRTMQQVRSDKAIGLKYAAVLMGAFGLIGLFLAAVGVYGVMAYTVSQQTHDIGVRMALGAGGRRVLRATLGQAMRLTSIGLVLGLLAAFGLGQLMAGLLFGSVTLDAATFVAFTVVLTIVALVASYLPARRAARIDPIVALRAE